MEDQEIVLPLVGLGGRARAYLRVVKDPSLFPLVVPQGILIKSGSQIADLISVLLVLGLGPRAARRIRKK